MLVKPDFDLTDYNSYRVKAVCKKAYFPETTGDVRTLFKPEGRTGKIILGGGYNVILTKGYYDEEFVIFGEPFSRVDVDGDRIRSYAGTSMLSLSELALKHSLKGLEIFYDIPSSLGGAVVMNAGASGEEIKDILVDVDYYDPQEDCFNTIARKDIDFEYRNSFFQKNPDYVICAVTLQLQHGEQQEIRDKMEQIRASRWAKQPKDLPNAGSVFKRPPGRFVGPMIEELGLKGFAVGGAKVSEKHGGFIVNYDNATGEDIVNLIKIVKAKVYEAFNVDLEVEQRML